MICIYIHIHIYIYIDIGPGKKCNDDGNKKITPGVRRIFRLILGWLWQFRVGVFRGISIIQSIYRKLFLQDDPVTPPTYTDYPSTDTRRYPTSKGRLR